MFQAVPSLFTVMAPLGGIMLSSLADIPITWQVYFDIRFLMTITLPGHAAADGNVHAEFAYGLFT